MTPEQPQFPLRPWNYVPEPVAPKPMHALVRFLFAAILVVVANIALPVFAFLLFVTHPLLADTFYRWGAAAVLLLGFIIFTHLLDRWDGDAWAYIGLPRQSSAFQQMLAVFAISAVLVTLAVAAIGLMGGLKLGFNFSGRAVSHELLVVLLLIGGALLEELAFRGYPFQRLVEAIRPLGAIVVISIFFGAVHLGNPNAGGILGWGFFNTILVGVLFAYAYLRTQTLWLPIGLHFGWNFFLGVVYGLPVSGLRDFSVVVRSTAAGSPLLTGGAYGIEASLTGTVVLILGFLLVAWAPKPELNSETTPQRSPEPGI